MRTMPDCRARQWRERGRRSEAPQRIAHPAAHLLHLALAQLRLHRGRQVALQRPARREVGVRPLRRPHAVAPPLRRPLPRQHRLAQARARAQHHHRRACAAPYRASAGEKGAAVTKKPLLKRNAHGLPGVEREHRGRVQRRNAVAHGLEVVHHAHRRRAQLLARRCGVDHPRQVGEGAALIHHRARGREARRGRGRPASLLQGRSWRQGKKAPREPTHADSSTAARPEPRGGAP